MSDLEFTLPSPEYERIAWVHNDHFTASVAPLEQSLRALSPRMNVDGLPNQLFVNGYGYGREYEMRAAEGPQDESVVLGWRERRMPAVDQACAAFESFDPASVAPHAWRETIEEHERRFWEAFGGVHADTMGQVFPASTLWMKLYVQRFGEARREDALAMLGGFPNASTERAVALWRLSRIAAAAPDVLEAVEAGRLPAPSSPAAREFLAGLDGLMARYGYTTTMHLLDLPTWAEDPAIPLRMVAAMAHQSDDHDPELAEARARQRREALTAELERLDASLDSDVRLLREVYRVARQLAPASEDHNLLCDQRMIAAARACWLRIGGALVARGAVARASDVFYHTLDELVPALEGGPALPEAELAARRDRQARWRASSPPARLGLLPPAAPEPRTLRGIAASRGVHRGRARLVASLAEAGRLQAGDVLVCPATSPEWTPYFGVVGALVTGAGGLLTHAAVVAREFGIPAVVAAADAMTAIPDGATVVVDGSNGVVTVQE